MRWLEQLKIAALVVVFILSLSALNTSCNRNTHSVSAPVIQMYDADIQRAALSAPLSPAATHCQPPAMDSLSGTHLMVNNDSADRQADTRASPSTRSDLTRLVWVWLKRVCAVMTHWTGLFSPLCALSWLTWIRMQKASKPVQRHRHAGAYCLH